MTEVGALRPVYIFSLFLRRSSYQWVHKEIRVTHHLCFIVAPQPLETIFYSLCSYLNKLHVFDDVSEFNWLK